MPRDSSGNYTLPLGNPVIDGTVIDTNWANPTMSDIAVQLNNVLTRDGLLAPTGAFYIVDGTAALPGLAFASQHGTGLWKDAVQVGISFQGAAKQTWGAAFSAFSVPVNVSFNSPSALSIIGAAGQNTGLQILQSGTAQWQIRTPAGVDQLAFTNVATPLNVLTLQSNGAQLAVSLAVGDVLVPPFPTLLNVTGPDGVRAMLRSSGVGAASGGTLFFGRNSVLDASIGSEANRLGNGSPNLYLQSNTDINFMANASLAGQPILSLLAAQQIVETSGIFRAGKIGTGVGIATLNRGDSASSGYVQIIAANGVRQGYIGQSLTTAAQDTGTIKYIAGFHSFIGSIVAGTNLFVGNDFYINQTLSLNGAGPLVLPRAAPSNEAGGVMIFVKGIDTSGQSFTRFYLVAIQINGGAPPIVAQTLVGSSGNASPSFTFGNSGGNLIVTGVNNLNVAYFTIMG